MNYELQMLLKHIKGPVTIVVGSSERNYACPDDALDEGIGAGYVVDEISALNGHVRILLKKSDVVPNDLGTQWAKDYKEKNGEPPSFF